MQFQELTLSQQQVQKKQMQKLRQGYELGRLDSVLLDAIEVREKIAVCERALIVSGVTYASLGYPCGHVVSWLKECGLWSKVTPWEEGFLTSFKLYESQRDRAKWFLERLWVLAWVLKQIGYLDHSQPCGPDLRCLIPGPTRGVVLFKSHIYVRPLREVVKEIRVLYDLKQKMLMGRLARTIKAEVILERSHAIQWVAGLVDWDDKMSV